MKLTVKEASAFLVWAEESCEPPPESEGEQALRSAVRKIVGIIRIESRDLMPAITALKDRFRRDVANPSKFSSITQADTSTVNA